MNKKLSIILTSILILSTYGIYKYKTYNPNIKQVASVINKTYNTTVELEKSNLNNEDFFKTLLNTYKNELNDFEMLANNSEDLKLKTILYDYSEGIQGKIDAYRIYKDIDLVENTSDKGEKMNQFEKLLEDSNKIILSNIKKLKNNYNIKISKDYYNSLEQFLEGKAEIAALIGDNYQD